MDGLPPTDHPFLRRFHANGDRAPAANSWTPCKPFTFSASNRVPITGWPPSPADRTPSAMQQLIVGKFNARNAGLR